MPSPTRSLSVAALLAFLFLPGCSNTLNPFCGSARPAPLIGALAPSTISFAQVQQGSMLVIKGSQFVSSSVVLINGKPLSASVVSSQQLKVMLTTSVISGPGSVKVAVQTPSGNSGDLGCTSGGTSSVLVLTVN
ncbi:MAG: IPT/TIG domain-containing protein [Terriglobales bacterium]